MKKTRIIINLCCLLLLALFSSCSLAKDATVDSEDKFIGLFISVNEFTDFATSSKGQISVQIPSEIDGKRVELLTYSFDEIDGYAFYTTEIQEQKDGKLIVYKSDEAFYDFQSSYFSDDSSMSNEYHALIDFLEDNDKSVTTLSFNIYEIHSNSENEVYLCNPHTTSFEKASNQSVSTTTSIDETITINNKALSKRTSFTIQIGSQAEPTKICFLQFDRNNNILSKNEYLPTNLPLTLSPESKTTFLLVESWEEDNFGNLQIRRQILDKTDEYYQSCYVFDKYVCHTQLTEIKWQTEN